MPLLELKNITRRRATIVDSRGKTYFLSEGVSMRIQSDEIQEMFPRDAFSSKAIEETAPEVVVQASKEPEKKLARKKLQKQKELGVEE